MSTYSPDSNSHSSEEPGTSLLGFIRLVKFKETALGRSGGGMKPPRAITAGLGKS